MKTIEEMARDAARYRWLRTDAFRSDWAYDEFGALLWDEELDRAIDRALAPNVTPTKP